jgi:hypothetical protein
LEELEGQADGGARQHTRTHRRSMGFTTAPTPPAQLALAYVASTFTFTCLYVCHMRLLHFVWPHLFELDLRLRMTNAERCNGVWHSTATVLLSGYGLWSSYAQHGWFQYDAPNSQVLSDPSDASC